MCIQLEGHEGARQRHIHIYQEIEKYYFTPRPCVRKGKEKKENIKALIRQDKIVSYRKVSDCVEEDINPDRIESRLKIGKVKKSIVHLYCHKLYV